MMFVSDSSLRQEDWWGNIVEFNVLEGEEGAETRFVFHIGENI